MWIHLFSGQTSWTTTQTTLASSWGLLVNIDSATGDIAYTTSQWIEGEKFWIFWVRTTAWVSFEFDTAVTRTWLKTLKLSNTDATGAVYATMGLAWWTTATLWAWVQYKHAFPVKASTKYKATCWVKTNNAAAVSAFIQMTQYNSAWTRWTVTNSNALTGTNDWTLCSINVTTWATTTHVVFVLANQVAWNISDAWFDVNSMTLEEVVEPVANSLTSSSPSLVSFTAVGSTDNIDQSLDPTGAYANTYTLTTAVNEWATHKQTFVPTKSKTTRIWVWVVAKGTGNWTLVVHDASNVVQATATIANASLTNGAFNYFTVPSNVTALGTYHFHVYSTVADGTAKVNTAWDLETCSFIENYYKPTTNFKASQNNQTVSISADEDGFLDGSVINLTTGSYTAEVNKNILNPADFANFFQWLYSYSWIHNTSIWLNNNQDIRIFYAGSIAENTFVFKVYWKAFQTVNITLPQIAIRFAGWYLRTSWSLDNSAYTQIHEATFTWSWASQSSWVLTITPSADVFYIKLVAGQTSATWNQQISLWYTDWLAIQISWTVDVSSLSTLRNYPTNKDVISQYSTTLGSPTTSATYRATKWGFPAIEYSATEYQFLSIDTTATWSTVAFSELWSSYATVADWASIAISSTSTPSIWVKTNITANRLYLSSNDYNASSDKDGSMKQSVVYQVKPNGNIWIGDLNSNIKMTYG